MPASSNRAGAERGSQAVQRALTVLDSLGRGGKQLSLSELAEITGLTMPTAHRMLKALQAYEYVLQDQLTGRYSLGPAVMGLARTIMQRSDPEELQILAVPYLEKLRAETGETVSLHVPMGTHRLCVAELVSREPIRMASGIGHVRPLDKGAAGKSILAWMSDESVALITEDFDDDRVVALRRDLARTRKRGFAISEGETVAGSAAVAAPVLASTGLVAGAINIVGPRSRWTSAGRRDAVAPLLESTKLLSAHLGLMTGDVAESDRT